MTSFPLRRLLLLGVLTCFSTLPVASSRAAAAAGAQLEVLDLDETAELLRVTPDVVRELAEAHRIPARQVGEEWRFSRAALLEWLKDEQFADTPRASPALPGNLDRAEALGSEQYGLSARGVTPPPTVGERPTTPTAEEIALRDQRVLLERGAVTLDFGASYARSEQALFPIIRQEQRTVGANAALRYGLLNDLQITARMPAVWRRTATFADATIGGTTSPQVTHDELIGDVSLSLLGVALRESVGRPNIIWSIDGVVPTGPGDRGLGGSLVLSKSYDPAVIFAGLSYLHGFSVEPTDSDRALAPHNFGVSLGYAYALNDSLALNTVFVGSYRNTQSPDGVSIPPPRERYELQFGMTWLITRGLFIEPAVTMQLGGVSPDIAVSLNIPYSF
jgi:excisionase family DNA binding protein